MASIKFQFKPSHYHINFEKEDSIIHSNERSRLPRLTWKCYQKLLTNGNSGLRSAWNSVTNKLSKNFQRTHCISQSNGELEIENADNIAKVRFLKCTVELQVSIFSLQLHKNFKATTLNKK